MENQHRLITGYRDLSADEIELMNEIKAEGERLRMLLNRVQHASPEADPRWLALARTDLQRGIMSLVRSVAKPDSF